MRGWCCCAARGRPATWRSSDEGEARISFHFSSRGHLLSALHSQSLVIDGLIISKWDRSVFEDMKKGGISAANCTVSVWEGFQATVDNIATMKRAIRDNADLLTLIRTTDDIK